MLLTDDGRVIDRIDVPENEWTPIDSIFVGNETSVKPVFDENEKSYIFVIELHPDKIRRLMLQFSNDESMMLTSVDGKDTDVNELQFLKHSTSMYVNVCGNLIDVSDWH